MLMRRLRACCLALSCLLASQAVHAEEIVRVAAAASLTDALTEIARDYRLQRGVTVLPSFAGSGALARQIQSGAPADLFISADSQWMDALQASGHVDALSRRDLLGNRLVLIAPRGQKPPRPLRLVPGPALTAAFRGRLCTGDPGSVPVGRYARAALMNLSLWDEVKGRLVASEDVRGALAFVARGECPLGIVYASDARASSRVVVLATFPAGSHPPVTYPAALLRTASPATASFLAYLASPAAQAVFRRHGFTPLTGP